MVRKVRLELTNDVTFKATAYAIFRHKRMLWWTAYRIERQLQQLSWSSY